MELSAKAKVTEVVKKTRSRLFKHLEVGDVIRLSYNLSGGYESAPTIKVELLDEDGRVDTRADPYARQLRDNMSNFKFEEL